MAGVNLMIQAQICDELLCRQAKFPRFLSQNGQNDPNFQYQPSIPGLFWVQIWWFQLKSVTCYRVDKLKVHWQTDRQTDGRTDRWTGAGNDNTPSAWKARGKHHALHLHCQCWRKFSIIIVANGSPENGISNVQLRSNCACDFIWQLVNADIFNF